jgi:hypothetical protein
MVFVTYVSENLLRSDQKLMTKTSLIYVPLSEPETVCKVQKSADGR